jgi:hypothetical protein
MTPSPVAPLLGNLGNHPSLITYSVQTTFLFRSRMKFILLEVYSGRDPADLVRAYAY